MGLWEYIDIYIYIDIYWNGFINMDIITNIMGCLMDTYIYILYIIILEYMNIYIYIYINQQYVIADRVYSSHAMVDHG